MNKPTRHRKLLKITLYSLILGALTGTFFAVMAGFFLPAIFPDWAGSFVCEGRMVFKSLQGKYLCYTSATSSYDLGDKVFWTLIKIFLPPCVAVCILLWFGFYKLIEFVTAEKSAEASAQ